MSVPVLRVLTWNVHGCVGRDGVFDPKRVAAMVEQAGADVCALQEVDARVSVRSIGALSAGDPFEYLAARCGASSLTAKTITGSTGHYGHLLVSRWPLESLGVEDLSVPGHEPRLAILARADTPFGNLAVVAVHLGLWPAERRRQLARLKRAIVGFGDRPVVALGDFNQLRARGSVERQLCPPLQRAPAVATYPALRPLFPLDRIWCTAPLEILSLRTLGRARRLSDHLPLMAELRWSRPRAV
jgi:endonuclease/exonuclease/phosphatase family metal-dependent hydrolase